MNEPTTEKKGIIAQMTEIDMLKSFRNDHLEKYVSSKMWSRYYGAMCKPDEVVVHQIQSSGQPGVPGIERKIKAKELQISELKINDKEKGIIKVIDDLIKEAEKNG